MVIYLLFVLQLGYAYPWGMFNPAVYIGARTHKDHLNSSYTINSGFMWGSGHKLKHEIDDSIHYTSLYNDPGIFSVSSFKDEAHSLNLTHVMINDEVNPDAWEMNLIGQHMGRTKYDKQHRFISVLFYISLDQTYHILRTDYGWEARNQKNQKIFTLELEFGKDNEYWEAQFYDMGIRLDNSTEQAWKVRSIAEAYLKQNQMQQKSEFGVLDNSYQDGSNLLLIQTVVKTPFAITVNYNHSTHIKALKHYQKQFDEKFDSIFAGKNKEMSKSALSNLLSGIGLFTGPIYIQEGQGEKHYSMYNTLFTCTPSRKVFPRGFLWDEGFHQLIVCRWNKELCIEMLKSWLNTMREDGWIPREQIRGKESESKVPKEFNLQRDTIANPPTLLYPIQYLADSLLQLSPEQRRHDSSYQFLVSYYEKLTRWLQWLRTTQMNSQGYTQWQGRSADHTLASGLDDYPRGLLVQPNERHLDIHIWILFFYKTLRNLSVLLDYSEDTLIYDGTIQILRSELKTQFWDGQKLADYSGVQYTLKETTIPAYLWRGDNKCGSGNLNPLKLPAECNPYSESPCCSEFGWCGSTRDHCSCPKCHRALKLESRKDVDKYDSYSPHIGYVSIMPILDSDVEIGTPEYEFILDSIKRKDVLMSEFGLRSLSKGDILYKSGEEYWRGPIWLNFNYLTLRALKKFYWEDPRAQEIYETLRQNLLKTVKQEWEKTGYFYEQYSDETGKGKRTRGFTGWTALIALIDSELY